MIPVGTPRCGVAQSRSQARLAEQASCLIDQLIEVMEGQHLFADGEEIGHSRPVLGEHGGTRPGGLE
jgi:hypothetical protein